MAEGKAIDKAGLYHEVRAENMHEGRMLERLNGAIARAATNLMKQWEEVGEKKGQAKISLTITISPNAKFEDFVDTDYTINTSVTPVQYATMARAAGGKLLVQPDGSSGENPDQLRMTSLYDQRGNLRARIDETTGEVTDAAEDGVAGRVGSA